jgi:hypothetical protein
MLQCAGGKPVAHPLHRYITYEKRDFSTRYIPVTCRYTRRAEGGGGHANGCRRLAPGGNRRHTRYTVTLPMRNGTFRPVTHPLHAVTRLRHGAVADAPAAAKPEQCNWNHGWTRINTDLECESEILSTSTWNHRAVGRIRTEQPGLLCRNIRVYQCPSAVLFCMDTAATIHTIPNREPPGREDI